jgi:hypothetical protein
MKILIDVMSGDNAPLEMIKGAAIASEEFSEEIVIVGDENVISDVAVKNEIDVSRLKIINSKSVKVCPSMLSIASAIYFSALYAGITTLILGISYLLYLRFVNFARRIKKL